MINALNKLKRGNQRFTAGQSNYDIESINSQRLSVAKQQKPFAVILGCSDSRVPAELIFDQGLGDLFVIRVAGNVVAPSLVGSVEFALAKFGTPLVVVLGHTCCSAVEAKVESLKEPLELTSPNIQSIMHLMEPALGSMRSDLKPDQIDLNDAIKTNVLYSVEQLRRDSELIAQKLDAGLINVTGACYDLETGVVTFYD